jgi:drug/metabolite transporter (DMT)-like permease
MNKTIKDIYQYALGAIVVLGFFVLLYILMKSEIPSTNRDLLSLIIGALIGSFTTVISYFYGSSKGSAEKDILLRNKDE